MSHRYTSSSYSSPYGSSRYTSGYDSTSNYGLGSGLGGGLTDRSSTSSYRYNSTYDKSYEPSRYSSYTPGRYNSSLTDVSSYTPRYTPSYDSSSLSKYKSSDYTPKYSGSDYTPKYSGSNYSPSKYTSDIDHSSAKTRSHDTDYTPKTRTSRDTDYTPKTRTTKTDDYVPSTRTSRTEREKKREPEPTSTKTDRESRQKKTTEDVGAEQTIQRTNEVEAISQKTESMNINNRHVGESARYQEPGPGGMPQYQGYTNPQIQSHSFKALQNIVEAGRDPANYSKNSPWQSQPVNVTANEPKKYAPSQTWKTVHDDKQGPPTNPSTIGRPYQPPGRSWAPPPPSSHSNSPYRQQPSSHQPPAPYQQPTYQQPSYQKPSYQQQSIPYQHNNYGSSPSTANKGVPMPRTEMPCGDSTAVKSTSVYNQAATDSQKTPVCSHCNSEIRGPFVLALNKSWCPQHFTCAKCNSELVNMGFVELNGKIYCENDYEAFFAPKCAKCHSSIVGDTVNALEKQWHPSCFVCEECSKPISSGAFHVENGKPYCMNDWQRLFQTKCTGCGYPVEPGDKWIEALDANWHSECFICVTCQAPLEGKPFYPRDGKPYCKEHAKA